MGEYRQSQSDCLGEVWRMSPEAIIIVVAFLIVGTVVGWFSQKSYAAHGDVKVAKNRLSGGRRTRWRAGVWALVLGVITLLALVDILHPHRH